MRRTASLSLVLIGIALSATAQRLPRTVIPTHYELTLAPDLQRESFDGQAVIHISIQEPTRTVVLEHSIGSTDVWTRQICSGRTSAPGSRR